MKRVVLLVLAVALGSSVVACQPTPPPPPQRARIVVYGDSLTEEAGSYLAAGFDPAQVDLVFHYYGGTALCQWLPSMREEAQQGATAVIIEFAGNSNDANLCMQDPTTGHAFPIGSEGWLDRYTADAATAQSIWASAGVPTYWTQIPPLGLPAFVDPNVNTCPLNLVYASVADHFIPAGSTVSDRTGDFAWWKRCALGEECNLGGSEGTPPTGTNQVRNPDMVHFCPTGTNPCSVSYVAGAARFGSAQATHVASTLGLAPPTPTSTTSTTSTSTSTSATTTTAAPLSTLAAETAPNSSSSRRIPGPSEPPVGRGAGPL